MSETQTDNLATLSVDGPVATITINRPESRNALSIDLLDALHARMDELEPLCGPALETQADTQNTSTDSDRVRVAVITGTGKAFSAGMDLRQVILDPASGGSGNPELPLQLLTSLARLTLRVRTLPAVTVAAVNGPAVGGGCGLVCVCDVSLTHAENKLGFPEVDLGLCPAVIAPWVVKKLGLGPARRALLMGGVMSGIQAHAIGLVDLLAESPDAFGALVSETTERLAAGGTRALAVTKGLLADLDGSRDEQVVLEAAKLSAEVLATPEAQAKLIERMR